MYESKKCDLLKEFKDQIDRRMNQPVAIHEREMGGYYFVCVLYNDVLFNVKEWFADAYLLNKTNTDRRYALFKRVANIKEPEPVSKTEKVLETSQSNQYEKAKR